MNLYKLLFFISLRVLQFLGLMQWLLYGKKIGTSCINLEKTHEIVRLFRTLLDYLSPKAILVTETNTPAREKCILFW